MRRDDGVQHFRATGHPSCMPVFEQAPGDKNKSVRSLVAKLTAGTRLAWPVVVAEYDVLADIVFVVPTLRARATASITRLSNSGRYAAGAGSGYRRQTFEP
jgi:hypothetical protein